MATINLNDNRQVIDYLARDYDSFRQALVDLIPSKLPEWTDRSEADFGIVLLELVAYMADILSYYQDRLANECFLATAQERRSVIQHLRSDRLRDGGRCARRREAEPARGQEPDRDRRGAPGRSVRHAQQPRAPRA